MNKYKKLKIRDGTTIDEHRLVWIKNNGKIPIGMVVHHIDGDKGNNNIQNLMLMSRSDHASFHNKGVAKPYLWRVAICGTASAYRRGCRCPLCKEHQRQRMADYRMKLIPASATN